MIQIYYLGNEFIESDSLAIELVDELKNKYEGRIEFIAMDTFEKMITTKDEQIFFDVADGIDKVELIESIDDFENVKSSTAHDMDFSFFLKLNKELENIKKVSIICLPIKRYENIIKDVTIIINMLIKK